MCWQGVPEENWLPVNRGDIVRLEAPDLERFENWTASQAEKIQ